jgi:hypothetical protein
LFFPEKLRVFDNVTQATTILIFEKGQRNVNKNVIKIVAPVKDVNSLMDGEKEYVQKLFIEMPEQMIVTRRTSRQISIIENIIKRERTFDSFAHIYQGEVNVSIFKDFIDTTPKNNNYKPLIRGNNISRYCVDLNFKDEKGSWVDSSKPFRNHQIFERIVTQEVSNMQQKRRLNGCIISKGIYVGHTANYILIKNRKYNLNFFVALLNSFLLDFIFQTFNSTNHIPARELKRLPIYEINFSNSNEKKYYHDLIALVDIIVDLNKSISAAKGNQREQIQRQIDKTNREIDEIVYKLYHITEEERKIIEAEV